MFMHSYHWFPTGAWRCLGGRGRTRRWAIFITLVVILPRVSHCCIRGNAEEPWFLYLVAIGGLTTEVGGLHDTRCSAGLQNLCKDSIYSCNMILRYVNRVCHSSGDYWDYHTGNLSFKTIHCNSFEDQAPVDEIYGCPIFKWVAVTWIHGRVPG